MTLDDELNMTSPCWAKAFKRAKAFDLFRNADDPAQMLLSTEEITAPALEREAAWYQVWRAAPWHLWARGAKFFTPICGEQFRLSRHCEEKLQPRAALPRNAQICAACMIKDNEVKNLASGASPEEVAAPQSA